MVTRRQYLLDARFGVILAGDRLVLERAAAALEDPVWGVWFGRKSCIPAEPVFADLFETRTRKPERASDWRRIHRAIHHRFRSERLRRRHGLYQRPAGQLWRRHQQRPGQAPVRRAPHQARSGSRQSKIGNRKSKIASCLSLKNHRLETLTPAKDRWTPIYLEHGRLEVDDSSIKWIGADRLVYRLPVATLSAVLLGPGTTVTHAAMKACADSNTPVCWIGEEGMRFYAFGITPNHDNLMPRKHAAAWADKKKRAEIARRMFVQRFPGVDVQAYSVTELRGMEGLRVRAKYAELGQQYGVTWKGRNYDKSNWNLADNINRALSTANASLYALCAAVLCSLGYLPSLGFVHDGGTLPFIYDVADLYKEITSFPAAFQAMRQDAQ